MTGQSKLVTGLIAGAAVGAAAGLLFAPRPGKETRGIVANRTSDLRHKAGHYVGGLRQRMKKESNGKVMEEASNDHLAAAA